jgi:hypothetical protein
MGDAHSVRQDLSEIRCSANDRFQDHPRTASKRAGGIEHGIIISRTYTMSLGSWNIRGNAYEAARGA